MCHIFLCIYQVLYNKIKRLKIKRKRRHKGKPVILRWSSGLLCLALSQEQSQRAPAQPGQFWLLWSYTAGDLVNQESDHQSAPSSIALSSFFLSRYLGRPPAMVSQLFLFYFHTLYSAWFPLWLPTQRQSLSLSMVGPTSLSISMKYLEHNFLSITPSYSTGLHFPLTLSQHPPQKSTHSLFHTCLWAAGEGIFLWMWLPSPTFSAS